MAEYIELIGVPGVGKTTTYNFLRSKATKNIKWIPYESLLKHKYTNGENFKVRLKQSIARIIRLNSISFNMKTLERFFKNNPELMELFWKKISQQEENTGEDLRFYGVNYVMSVLEKIQNIRDFQLAKFCILDEGLVHNINYFTTHTSNLNRIAAVLDVMDLPKAVIYFDGQVDDIIDRTLIREKLRPRDENLSLKELINSRLKSIQEKELYIEAVTLRRIPVLRLDARESVIVKSNQIQSFIQTLPKFQKEIKNNN